VVYSGTGGLQTNSANLTFDGTTLTTTGVSNTGTSTIVKLLTVGNTSFNGTTVFAAATPAKLYMGTGTVTDVTSAVSATNTTGAIASLAITPIAASNTGVTYTNASTLYIAGAPSAGTNITITNPYALYVNAGASYFNAAVNVTGFLNNNRAAGADTYFTHSTTGINNTVLGFNNSGATNSSGVTNNTAYIGSLNAYSTWVVGNGATIAKFVSTAQGDQGLAVTGTLSATGDITSTGIIKANLNGGNPYALLQADSSGATGGKIWTLASNATGSALGTAGGLSVRSSTDGITVANFISTGLAVTGYITATNTSNTTVASGGFDATTSSSLRVLNASTTAGTGAGIYFLGGTNSESWIGNLYDSSGVGSLSFQTRVSGTRAERASISTTGVFTTVLGASIQGLRVGLSGGNNATSTAMGVDALLSSTGTDATAFGYFAGKNLTSGAFSIAIGSRAMGGGTGVLNTGSYNTAIGNSALAQNTSGNRNVAIGNEAMASNQSGAGNLAIGPYNQAGGDAVLSASTAGNNNTAVGGAALSKTTVSNITGVGYSAGFNNTSGTQNTYLGTYAGYYNQTGINNTALGFGSLGFNILTGFSTGSENTAVGSLALYAISSGGSNTALGFNAGVKVTSGSENVLIGVNAGQKLQTGAGNTIIGRNAGVELVSGSSNVIIGLKTGVGGSGQNVTGSQNTFVGPGSGAYVTTGQNNTIIGGYDGLAAPISQTNSNVIALSDGAGNLRCYFNSSGYPFMTTMQTGISSLLYFNSTTGEITYSTSSARFKDNIRDTKYGLSDVMKMRSVMFEYKSDGKTDVGVIAEEMEEIVPEIVGKDKDGAPENVGYERLAAVLIKAIQELKTEFDAYKASHP
jgi:hypothetical protein